MDKFTRKTSCEHWVSLISIKLFNDEEFFRLTDTMEFPFIEIPKLIDAWQADLLNPWDDILVR